MLDKAPNINDIESLIEELSDEELASYGGGLLQSTLLNGDTLISGSLDLNNTDIDIHALPDSIVYPTYASIAGVTLDPNQSLRATNKR
ncbi:MAG: hypothetical protein KME08_01355 [Aphanothece sp. CMT-3BRIN-NPC111]|jgi:hypothetical protein|nr:hypothetical protein [Aphanothece sp. CMT-3BRIN-NPC111]